MSFVWFISSAEYVMRHSVIRHVELKGRNRQPAELCLMGNGSVVKESKGCQTSFVPLLKKSSLSQGAICFSRRLGAFSNLLETVPFQKVLGVQENKQ